ncbi:RNA-binding transcriptional accessory protein [Pseudidiomarina sp. 1ASP75-14]|uniref:Tex family protein n=1 Tax=Pseudidiomarina terrestris TaxID=2820060 RepID=UPI0026555A0E|nr:MULTISPECIES: Tex family protein [unclassified Pseudidiomarina]MDN7126209.1 RNA-binding transcriptional accessory protein [Pseudidiomarina sp. 1APR75-33.1]MDN7137078.1 RNA-binding transcriptional accessory protein [Pseudidiomarina sp. 1ASP75-14]
MSSIPQQIANELAVSSQQVQAAIALLDDGATVPFIARYRKEATGGLDDTQLRNLAQRLTYLRELNDRREVILASIRDQEKLTPQLEQQIRATQSKTELEDLYLPYKPKRRTKGQIAIEAGLEPLALSLLENPAQDPEQLASGYINQDAGFADSKAVLEGARFILMEKFAEDAALLKKVRDYLWNNAEISSVVATGKEQEGSKYRDYFSFSEALKKIPSHRALALFRGRNEGMLQLKLNADPQQEDPKARSYGEQIIAGHIQFTPADRAADAWLQQTIQWTWRIKLLLHMETELFGTVRERAEADAIKIFANNLKDLLMAAPAGAKTTMGLDPGVRTGIKVAVVDSTGKVLGTNTVFPFQPQNQVDKAMRTIAGMCKQHKVELIAIGNGTHSRETDKLVGDLLKADADLKASKVIVNEAGASVYSASELAAQEFPDLDVSLRGAVSIARRLQDPLAELVKIEPKSIGVGQYQHDVSQAQLAQSLDAVVEDCVNAVGVDVNTASVALLARVAGLNKTLAQNMVAHRDANGRFEHRKSLLDVSRMGPKSFEQAAGFLRVMDGSQPLDRSAVHPEAYPLVERMAADHDKQVAELIGDSNFLKSLDANAYTDDTFGLPTVRDIIRELDKPGRDPRPEFKTASFKEGVDTLQDLRPGMTLEGVVSNVAAFGAFVDIGVHQDGLVHVSALSDNFVSDPREVVKAGDIVKVKVMDVDVQRKRISLSMKLNDEVTARDGAKPAAAASTKGSGKPKSAPAGKKPTAKGPPSLGNSAMGSAFADAFAKAKK